MVKDGWSGADVATPVCTPRCAPRSTTHEQHCRRSRSLETGRPCRVRNSLRRVRCRALPVNRAAKRPPGRTATVRDWLPVLSGAPINFFRAERPAPVQTSSPPNAWPSMSPWPAALFTFGRAAKFAHAQKTTSVLRRVPPGGGLVPGRCMKRCKAALHPNCGSLLCRGFRKIFRVMIPARVN
jgi:hypothetical protein